MTDLARVIDVDPEKCLNCHACIAACPVKFCNDASGDYVKVNPDLCIGCGNCIDACTHDARRGVDDFDRWLQALTQGERMIAISAPALAANFPGKWQRVHGWLRSLGVREFFDVSFGAELTVKSYLSYAEQAKPATIIAQPCPAIVSYVQMYQPALIPWLAPADSPMVHTIKMIRQYFRNYADHKIVILSPCLAKRREFDAVGLGDYNVTYQAITDHLTSEGVNLDSFSEVEFAGGVAERAVLFSTPGGLQRTVERENPQAAGKTRRIEGPHVVYDYLKALPAAINAGVAPMLVDCLNCEMGCNGGPGTVTRSQPVDVVESHIETRQEEARRRYLRGGFFRSAGAARRRVGRVVNRYWEAGLYSRVYEDRSSRYSIETPTNRQLEGLYQQMLKHSRQDFLNCGSCGYGSCEQMATAIHNGLNRRENCFHYERESRNEMTQILFDGIRQTSEKLTTALDRFTGTAGGPSDGGPSEGETVSMRDVAEISRGMRTSVEEGLAHIERTIENMDVIRSSNRSTEDRMNILTEQIRSIGEIVGIINAIADQTKIIAFNAELEASSAGETGRSFEIVAAEIRRLANNTGTSTTLIREKITEIQGASNELVASSKREGANISAGAQIAAELQSVFGKLSRYAADADQQINSSIDTQVRVFEEAMAELEQIRHQIDGYFQQET